MRSKISLILIVNPDEIQVSYVWSIPTIEPHYLLYQSLIFILRQFVFTEVWVDFFGTCGKGFRQR